MQEQVQGRIHSIIFNSEESGYAVFRLETLDAELITLVGCVPIVAPGEGIAAFGKWIEHPSHGKQFSIEEIERTLPDTSTDIYEYLASGVIRGIGKTTAKQIVDHFGDNTLDILESEPKRLCEVKGITVNRAKVLSDTYAQQSGLRRLMSHLTENDISPLVAVRLMQRYGPSAILVLRDNPYILVDKYYDVDFGSADSMALADDWDENDTKRIQAAILYELTFNLEEGHVYIPRNKLIEVSGMLIEVEQELVESSLDYLIEIEKIVQTNEKNCYHDYVWEAELFVANFMKNNARKRLHTDFELSELIIMLENELEMQYAPAQRQAVMLAAQSPIMLLTGGPGTGKTTVVRALIALYEKLKLKVCLAAPTGRAAKRLSEMTGQDAKTIHRLLEFGYDVASGDFCFLKNEKEPLETDVVIIDETSMVDILLMHSLLKAMPVDARLVLVGDPDQLPAVGPGNVLDDLIKSEFVDTVQLTEIFRQAQQSKIVMNSHSVNKGQLPVLKNEGGDMFFMRRKEMQSAIDTIVELCADRLPKGLKVDPSQIQVLSPTRKGLGGTVSLNRLLQEALNPAANHKLERRFGDIIFREGDRVMQTRNNYMLKWVQGSITGMGIFNGDVGIIQTVDLKQESVIVLFDDKFVKYSFNELGELELAFAMTIHKAQGSEYSAVVLACMNGPQPLMNRRVLYTGMTRAKDWLIMVGDENVVETMVNNNRKGRRYSGLMRQIIND